MDAKLRTLAEAVVLLEDPKYSLIVKHKMTDKQAMDFIVKWRNTPEFEQAVHNIVAECKGIPESKDTLIMKLNNLYTRSLNTGKSDTCIKVIDQLAKWNQIESVDNSFNITIVDKTNGNL